jgi:mono/diheme cytochrome c family protein
MHKLTVHLKPGVFLAVALAVAASLAYRSAAAEDLSDVEAWFAAANLDHGRKLYENNCDACHTTTLHWRDKRLVDSWTSLLQQVDRWQRNSGQSWAPADIKDVAAYLNARFYRLPCPADECAATQASVRSTDARIN